jgi:AraC-like DNA-binding protein
MVAGMDALSGFLEGPRAREAFLLRCSMEAPWSLRIEDRAPLTLIAVVRGEAWILPDGAPPCRIGPGDSAIVVGPHPYTVADDPGSPPQILIGPGEVCTTLDGARLVEQMTLGVRTWGNAVDGATVLLTGTYESVGEVSRPLLDALPRVAVLGHDEWENPLVGLLAEEIVKDRPGQAVVLDRLLDLLVLASLREWFSRPGGEPPAWYRAQSDPVIGHALQLIHHQPAQDWTVASLASHAGVSRAALARRFHDVVGDPPLTYLTKWRLALAADLLLEPGATVGRVARQVGYGSPFSLSTAFKRAYGMSPSQHRSASRTDVLTGP